MSFELDTARRHKLVRFTEDELDEIVQTSTSHHLISYQRCRGGFSHTNVRVQTAAGTFLVRFHANIERKESENFMLQSLTDYPFSPQLIHPGDGENWSVLSWIDGDVLRDSVPTEHRGHAVGKLLADIHDVGYEQGGIFRGDGTRSIVFEHPGLAHLEYCLTMLANANVKKRLQRSTADIRAKLREREDVFRSASSVTLVHSDFNPKNIIVHGDDATAIDWEWSHAGCSLSDIGNLERGYAPLGPKFWGAFRETYGSRHTLDEETFATARLIDLSSQFEFLSWDHDRPKVFRRARQRIGQVLFG